jgi:hypothetical protein
MDQQPNPYQSPVVSKSHPAASQGQADRGISLFALIAGTIVITVIVIAAGCVAVAAFILITGIHGG